MNPLERILGSMKFNSLSELEKMQVKELIAANQIYEHLVAGIIGGHGWRIAISEAHSKYAKPAQEEKTVKADQAKILKEDHTNKNKIFGAGEFDNFTKSGIIM